MAFVNEYISEENIKKYDIEALDKKYNKGFNKPDWTVDHERDMYLRYINSGREEFSDEYTFCFYWQAQLFEMTFKVNGGGGYEVANCGGIMICSTLILHEALQEPCLSR